MEVMNAIETLVTKLNEILALEPTTDGETLAGYIVGELLGDYDDIYEGLYDNDMTVQRIGDLASDLEWSNAASPEELQQMWDELKKLVKELEQRKP